MKRRLFNLLAAVSLLALLLTIQLFAYTRWTEWATRLVETNQVAFDFTATSKGVDLELTRDSWIHPTGGKRPV